MEIPITIPDDIAATLEEATGTPIARVILEFAALCALERRLITEEQMRDLLDFKTSAGARAFVEQHYIRAEERKSGRISAPWIDVTARLPEQDSSVLVAGAGRYVTVAEWYKESGWSVGREELFGSSDVTHWLPLPLLPGAVEKDA